jgi:hypothetical protein
MPPPGFGFSEAARALRPTVSDIIWNLHCIIANPNSKLDEVRTARRRLLRLLKTSKFQKMIAPPLVLPVEPTERGTAATKRLDSAAPSDAVHANLTITRIEDPLEGRRKSSAPRAPTASAKSVRCFQLGI